MLYDIELIYNCIKQNGEIQSQQFFQRAHPYKYWNYLKYYPWLTAEQQERFITGCLNIILFLVHNYLENGGGMIKKYYNDINRAVNNFQPITEINEKLHYMVKESLILSWKKMNDFGFDGKRDNLYQSISWTLKYTIMKTNNPLQE